MHGPRQWIQPGLSVMDMCANVDVCWQTSIAVCMLLSVEILDGHWL